VSIPLASSRSISSKRLMDSEFLWTPPSRPVTAAAGISCPAGSSPSGGGSSSSSLVGEGGRSPASIRDASASVSDSVCRLLLASLVNGSPSLLTAADLSSGTVVSRALVLSAVSIGQSSLVSRLSEASGAVSRLEALVSHSPFSPAATISLGSSPFRMLTLSFSISLYCCVPTTLQACQHLPTPNTCTQTQLLSS